MAAGGGGESGFTGADSWIHRFGHGYGQLRRDGDRVSRYSDVRASIDARVRPGDGKSDDCADHHRDTHVRPAHTDANGGTDPTPHGFADTNANTGPDAGSHRCADACPGTRSGSSSSRSAGEYVRRGGQPVGL